MCAKYAAKLLLFFELCKYFDFFLHFFFFYSNFLFIMCIFVASLRQLLVLYT